ncbi:MAG: zinc ribbon domain-containing protein [Gallionella sp.]
MPIYAYGCSSCGLQKDVMQKMSDVPLTICPVCGKETLSKQLTAAGFQLKGSGYYVTDFKGGPQKSVTGRPESGKPSAGKPDAKPDSVAVPAAGTVSSTVTSGTA